MSLLSTNLSRQKKTPLKLKLPEPERRNLDPIPEVERPPTQEDIQYSKLVEKNPALDKLIDAFGLTNKTTGEKLQIVNPQTTTASQEAKQEQAEQSHAEHINEPQEPSIESKPKHQNPVPKRTSSTGNNSKLQQLAHRIMEGETNYSKKELIEQLQKETDVNPERAEKGIDMMIEAGIIEQWEELYYMAGSSPF